jgi:protein-S-isoprenylcysteine O-methyltransferase Ste14
MLGLLIAFWAAPTMSVSHLVFSLGMTAYILFGIYFEEKGLAATLGPEYVLYRQRTARVIPKLY